MTVSFSRKQTNKNKQTRVSIFPLVTTSRVTCCCYSYSNEQTWFL